MTTPFKREPRYFVFKISDMRKHLSRDKFELVGSIAEKLNAGRAVEGKVPLDAVVVESDWPEYEPVWAMIEARMTGIAQSKKTHCDCKNPSQCWEPCGELGHSAEHVGKMTASRAEMFMTRFKHEEKMLGPNEQAALDYVIAMLVAKQEQGGPVAWNEDQAYAWGRGCYEIVQGATTGWKLFGQLTPKEQAYWVAKAAFEQATQQQRKPLTRDERENVFAEAEKLMDADDNLSWRIAILKATEAATALRNKHE